MPSINDLPENYLLELQRIERELRRTLAECPALTNVIELTHQTETTFGPYYYCVSDSFGPFAGGLLHAERFPDNSDYSIPGALMRDGSVPNVRLVPLREALNTALNYTKTCRAIYERGKGNG